MKGINLCDGGIIGDLLSSAAQMPAGGSCQRPQFLPSPAELAMSWPWPTPGDIEPIDLRCQPEMWGGSIWTMSFTLVEGMKHLNLHFDDGGVRRQIWKEPEERSISYG